MAVLPSLCGLLSSKKPLLFVFSAVASEKRGMHGNVRNVRNVRNARKRAEIRGNVRNARMPLDSRCFVSSLSRSGLSPVAVIVVLVDVGVVGAAAGNFSKAGF